MTVNARIPRAREYHCFIPTGGLSLGINPVRRHMTVKVIQDAVCAYYGLPFEIMARRTKNPVHAHPRMLAMYLARDLTKQSLPEIGRRFHRDHSTVHHAIAVVRQRISDDDHTARDLTAIRLELAA